MIRRRNCDLHFDQTDNLASLTHFYNKIYSFGKETLSRSQQFSSFDGREREKKIKKIKIIIIVPVGGGGFLMLCPPTPSPSGYRNWDIRSKVLKILKNWNR